METRDTMQTNSLTAALTRQALFLFAFPLFLLVSLIPITLLSVPSTPHKPLAADLPPKIIMKILQLVPKVHASDEQAIPDYRTLAAASRISRRWRAPAQDVIWSHTFIIGDRRASLFIKSSGTARLAWTKSKRAELIALSGAMILGVCELLGNVQELSLRADVHRHLLNGACSCAIFGLPALKNLKDLELAIRPMPGITIPSFALSSLTLYLENRIPLTFLSTLFRASENSLKSLTLNFIPREAHPDLLLAALPVVAPNLNFLSITNTTAQLVACLESCTKLKTMQLQPQSTIASLRVLLKTSPTSTLPPSLEELSLDSSEGGLVQRVKVLLEAQKESVLPRIYLINARITSTLVAKPYIDELRSNGAIVVVV